MRHRRFLPPALVAAAVVLSSCSPGSDTVDEPTPEPEETMTESPEDLQRQFMEQSGLTLPSDAEDLEIEGKLLDGERPYYEVRFETTRGGAEVICTAENLGTYRSSGGPSEEQHELFPVQEDDEAIEQTVKCSGGHPTNGRVDREVMVLFPEEGLNDPGGEPDGADTAVVYAYTVELPSA